MMVAEADDGQAGNGLATGIGRRRSPVAGDAGVDAPCSGPPGLRARRAGVIGLDVLDIDEVRRHLA